MQFKSRGRALRNQALATAAVQIGRQGGGSPVSQVHSLCICIIYGYTDSGTEDTYMKRRQQTMINITPCDSADQPTHKYHCHSHSFLGNSSTRRLASKATLERRTPLAGSDKVPAPKCPPQRSNDRATTDRTLDQPPTATPPPACVTAVTQNKAPSYWGRHRGRRQCMEDGWWGGGCANVAGIGGPAGDTYVMHVQSHFTSRNTTDDGPPWQENDPILRSQ